ncbi:tandem-95 repeat protein, partial [Dasania marina]|uniref:beta strand repeat-containing protein n=1 Tax=Dasania marina TaxID=471499 RepID=UPI0030D7FB03
TAVAGDTVATFTASDLDGDAITYSITSGNAAGYFEILDNTTGVVTLTDVGETAIENDTLNLGDQIIGVTANDGVNNSAEASVTIEITHVNDNAPTIDTSAGSTQVENTAVDGDTVATFTASDLDGDAITYSITSGNAAGYFEILDNTTGVVTLTAAGQSAIEDDVLNLADQVIGVTANDGVNDSVEATATIAITHVNDNAPTVDTATGSTQVENTAVAGDTVATFTASDLDGDAITYSITSGNASGYFAIRDNTTGVVTLTAAGQSAIEDDVLNLADQVIGVTANDGVNDSVEATATIAITHVNDNAPTVDTATGSTQVENTAVAGDTVATFTASDLDGDAITYSITSGNAAGYFAILDDTTGVVTLTAIGQAAIEDDTLNLSDQIIGVTANDGVNDSAEASVTIEITHVNDNAPTIDTSAGSTQVENTAVAGDTVATFTASDLDGDAITYSITSGNAAGYFEILDNTTGVVTLTATGQTAIENDTLNLGDQIIGVTANDGVNNSAEASVTIEITHVNDNAPTMDSSAGSTQVENTAVDGDTVATFTASDLDGDAITYSITSGNAAGYFEILDNTSGVVTLTAAGQTAIEDDVLNLADQVIGVTANDGANNSVEATATISITHVNDNAPTIDTSAGSTQVENTAVAGDTVATFTASDLDGDTITYNITSGNANGYFAIDVNTGVVTLTADGQTAIEDDALNLADQVIGVTATDGTYSSAESTATIAINHVNDNAPTTAPVTLAAIIEDSGARVITQAELLANASDADGDAMTAVNVTIASGNGTLVDNSDGTYTYTPASNDGSEVTFNYDITDGTLTSSTGTASLDIIPVADAPTLSFNSDVTNPTTGEEVMPPVSTGLLLSFYDDLNNAERDAALQEGVIDPADATSQSRAIDGFGTTQAVTATNIILNDGSTIAIGIGDSYAITGLIFLTEGSQYQFSGYHDDSLRIELGGQTLVSTTGDSYGNYGPGTSIGSDAGSIFTPTESGYYTFELFTNNVTGIGQFSVNLGEDGDVKELTASNYNIYTSVSDLIAVDGQFGNFVASTDNVDGGYFPQAINVGIEGTFIEISNIEVTLSDDDTSESISDITISGLPVGSVLTDGTTTFTATSGNTSVDVAAWDLTNIKILPPSGLTGNITLTVSTTSIEVDNGDTATTQSDITVTVIDPAAASAGVDSDLLGDGIVSGTAGDDLLSGDKAQVNFSANSSNVYTDNGAFTLAVGSINSGLSVASIMIRLTDGNWDPTGGGSFGPEIEPGSENGVTVSDTDFSFNGSETEMTITFADGDFTTGDSFSFGIDFDNVGSGNGNEAGRLGGNAQLVVTLSDGSVETVAVTGSGNTAQAIANVGGALVIDGGEGNDTLNGSALDELLVGGDGNDIINAGDGTDVLVGGQGDDILDGGAGTDRLVGGLGDDILTGGLGADVFEWELADQGTTGAADTITDFDVSSRSAGGDVLDLKDLLVDETEISLTEYLYVEDTGTDTVIHISTAGGFTGGAYDASAEDQSITLTGVDLAGGDQATIIQNLIDQGKLITD